MIRNIQQDRARFALKLVQDSLKDGVNSKEFRSYANSLPSMIHQVGLGQAAAFLRSKREPAYKSLYDGLQKWLCAKEPWAPYEEQGDLLQQLSTGDLDAYLAAQAEALEISAWIKRIARAEIEGETS